MRLLRALKVPTASFAGAVAVSIVLPENADMLSLVGFHAFFLRHKRFNIPHIRAFPHQKLLSALGLASIGLVSVLVADHYASHLGADYHKEQFIDLLTNRSRNDKALADTRITVFAPLFEEVLFRGILVPHFQRYMSYMPSMLLSSVMFGLAHPGHEVGSTIFGVGQCLIYKLLQCHPLGLLAPIATHAAWNTMVVKAQAPFFYGNLDKASTERKIDLLTMMKDEPEKLKGLEDALNEMPNDAKLVRLRSEIKQCKAVLSAVPTPTENFPIQEATWFRHYPPFSSICVPKFNFEGVMLKFRNSRQQA